MIFQLELTTLDDELSQLQALLSAKQQQRNLYNQLQQQTEGYLVGLAKLKEQIAETVGGGAIANLKNAVLTLFDPGDHGDNGGNQFIDPAPDTDPTSGADSEDDGFDIIALNGETGDCLTTDDLDGIDDAPTKLTYAQAIKRRCSACWGYEVETKADIKSGFVNRANLNFMEAVNLERSGREFYQTVESYLDRLYYTGQSCDIDSAPLTGQACGWASPFASPLCSLIWEDAPFTGQYCTITPSVTEIIENKGTSEGEHMPYAEFVEVSDKVGYIKVVHSGEIKATYAGFSRKDRAEAWGRLLAVTHDIASGFEVRSARHLPCKWELKLWDMSISQIQKLAAEDLTKSPRGEVNSAKPPAREPVVLDSDSEALLRSADRIVVGQRILTKDGQILEISSTLSADNRFFAKNANEQRQLIELNNVAEFLPTSSPAQAAGIEPPAGWGKPQVQEQPIALGALIRHCTNAKFNIFEYGIVQEISESSVQIWNEQEGSSKSVAIADLELIAADPQYAKILDSKSEWLGQTFVVIQTSKAGLGYSVLTPKGIIWFRGDGGQILDAETEEIAPASEPEQAELPIYQRSDGSFEVEQSVKEQASILQVGDVVEITGSRHPQHFGLVGTVESLSHFSELPLSVRTPRGLKGYLRSDLKLVSKGEAPKRAGLQPGQVLMGDRIVTSGNYAGLARQNAINNARSGQADKLAALELVKAGMPPEQAWAAVKGDAAVSVMASLDDVMDF